jgi:hypothetical protein
MKKILAHLTGIVFLITILIAGGCNQEPGAKPAEDKKKVEIYCKAIEIDGKKHLIMYDSKDLYNVVVDSLVTDVKPGTRVIWKLVQGSGIEEFVKIGPKNPGQIMTGNAEKVFLTKKLKFKIPKEAPIPSEREKYDIKVKDIEGNIWEIDPYLRIPQH